jgi:hypothetical protein
MALIFIDEEGLNRWLGLTDPKTVGQSVEWVKSAALCIVVLHCTRHVHIESSIGTRTDILLHES